MAEVEANNNVVNGQDVVDTTTPEVDYLNTIKELKEKSVDRSEYDKLRAENKRLLEDFVNGKFNGTEEQEETHRSITDIRDDLFNHEHSNLDYVKLSLELRDALIAEGQPDPFIPTGKQLNATREDAEAAENVANIYRECVEYADGDSGVFTNELMRRTKDIKIRR